MTSLTPSQGMATCEFCDVHKNDSLCRFHECHLYSGASAVCSCRREWRHTCLPCVRRAAVHEQGVMQLICAVPSRHALARCKVPLQA